MAAAVAPVVPIRQSEAALAGRLSPSQIRTFADCSAKWWYAYGRELPEPKNGNLGLGAAVDEAIGATWAHKAETGEDLEAGEVLEAYRAAWARVSAEIAWRDEENPAEVGDAGEKLVELYMAEAAAGVRPVAVQIRVEGEIGGVPVQGWIDCLEADGAIRELKTAGRKPGAELDPPHAMQVATYAALTPGASGLIRVDTLVKTKVPQLVQIERRLEPADYRAGEVQYPLMRDAMRAGYYTPNRGSMLCSRRNCAFWRECQEDYGGTVPAS